MDSDVALSKLVQIAEEQLRWQRASLIPMVRKTVEETLTSAELRMAYELCDGETASSDIATAVGVSKSTMSNWTRRWRDAGIAYETDNKRIRHLISLTALGIETDVVGGAASMTARSREDG